MNRAANGRRVAFRIALVVSAASFASLASSSLGAGAANTELTVYAKATQVQFVDHSDDRARAANSNPFNLDTKALPPQGKDGKGPLPGDNALFNFEVYKDPRLTQRTGSAVYACTFNFAHHAVCEASFELRGGTMFAAGPADFDSTRFTLAVTSGTGKYLGAHGQVTSAPAAKDAHRLEFVLR